MEKMLTAESAVMEKTVSQKVTSKQLEAKITVYTVLFAVIILNVLWWAGSRSIVPENVPAMSTLETVQHPHLYTQIEVHP